MIYIASPYSHPNLAVKLERYHKVMDYCAYLFNKKQHPYSPIVYGHCLAMRHALPTDVEYWKDFNHSMMRLSSVLHIYAIDGWEQSLGIADEIAYANELGMPLVYVDEVL